MKYILLAFLLVPTIAYNQIIQRFAGTDVPGYSGDGGPATAAMLSNTYRAKPDLAGNVYITDINNNVIRMVDTHGIITTFAGNGSPLHSGDGGPATAAGINGPQSIAIDNAGNMFIAEDTAGGVGPFVRKINTAGVITTIAGNGIIGFSGDGGPATDAEFKQITDLAVDGADNVYIADRANNRIRKIDNSGIISTIAGLDTILPNCYVGDGGPATAAVVCLPTGIAVDTFGNVYIASEDPGSIRKIGTSGIITTVAGNSVGGETGDGGPATAAELNVTIGVGVDNYGNIYIADGGNQRVRKINSSGIITTIAGNGTLGTRGNGGPATAAFLDWPDGVSVDQTGNVYIAEPLVNIVEIIPYHTNGISPVLLPAASITLSPNPVSGLLTINSSEKINEIAITDLVGQIYYAHTFDSETVPVDVSTLPPGVYFVRINGTEVRKFVKE